VLDFEALEVEKNVSQKCEIVNCVHHIWNDFISELRDDIIIIIYLDDPCDNDCLSAESEWCYTSGTNSVAQKCRRVKRS
jgi:hypothetical protein